MQIAYRSTIDHLTGLGIGIPAIHQVTAAIAGNAGHRQVFIGGAGDKLIIELRKIRLLWLWVRLRLRLWLRQNIDVPLRTAGRQQHQCRRQQTKHPFSVFSHFLFPPCCMLYCLLLQWFQLRYNSANVIDTPATGDYNMLCYSKEPGGYPMKLFCAALTAAPVTGDNSIVPIAIIAMAIVVVIAAVLLLTSRKK